MKTHSVEKHVVKSCAALLALVALTGTANAQPFSNLSCDFTSNISAYDGSEASLEAVLNFNQTTPTDADGNILNLGIMTALSLRNSPTGQEIPMKQHIVSGRKEWNGVQGDGQRARLVLKYTLNDGTLVKVITNFTHSWNNVPAEVSVKDANNNWSYYSTVCSLN